MMPRRDRFDVGILVVPGFREQRRGRALVNYVDAFYDVLHRASGRDGLARETFQRKHRDLQHRIETSKATRAQKRKQLRELAEQSPPDEPVVVRISDASLRTPEGDGPAFFALNIGDDVTWCMAESWWAEDFDPPPARNLLRWALSYASTIAIGHFARRVRQLLHTLDRRRPVALAVGLLARSVQLAIIGLLTFLLVPLVLSLLLALTLLAALPVPKLSSAVDALATRLLGPLADSFVLINSDAQYGAASSRVRRDLEWLSQRCDHIVLLAHGQGVPLSADAVRHEPVDQLRCLITLGSGLIKMETLLAIRNRQSQGQHRNSLFSVVYIAALLVFVVWGVRTFGLADAWPVLALGLLLSPAMAWGSIDGEMAATRETEQRLVRRFRLRAGSGQDPLPWYDLFASADPVPGGPLSLDAPGWLQIRPVANRASWLQDHGLYLRNHDGVVAQLVSTVLAQCQGAGGAALDPLAQPERVDQWRVRRNWRIRLLVWCRMGVALGALALLRRHSATIKETADSLGVGEHAQSFWLRLPEGLRSAIASIDLVKVPAQWTSSTLTYLSGSGANASSILLVVTAALLAYTPIWVSWRMWERQDLTFLLRSRPPMSIGAAGALCLTVATALLALWGCLMTGARGEDPDMSMLELAGLFSLVPVLLPALPLWAGRRSWEHRMTVLAWPCATATFSAGAGVTYFGLWPTDLSGHPSAKVLDLLVAGLLVGSCFGIGLIGWSHGRRASARLSRQFLLEHRGARP